MSETKKYTLKIRLSDGTTHSVSFEVPLGPEGNPGESAYEAAVKGGYTGTLEQFYEDIALVQDIPTEPEDIGAQPAGDYLTEVPEGYAKTEDLPRKIITAESGDAIALTDSEYGELTVLNLYGKTTQDGTPTPEAPVEMVNAGDSGSITISVGKSAEDTELQTHAFLTPKGLAGIPVDSGGNYTDDYGQQWICDEIDFARGVYVQRVSTVVMDGTEPWISNIQNSGTKRFYFNGKNLGVLPSAGRYGLFTHGDVWITSNMTTGNRAQIVSSTVYVYMENYQTLETFTAFVAEQYTAGTPLAIKYVIETPIETALSAEELAAYENAALRTYYPNTAITNDAGAGMNINYPITAQSYIDKKIAELAAAIV